MAFIETKKFKKFTYAFAVRYIRKYRFLHRKTTFVILHTKVVFFCANCKLTDLTNIDIIEEATLYL